MAHGTHGRQANPREETDVIQQFVGYARAQAHRMPSGITQASPSWFIAALAYLLSVPGYQEGILPA